MNKAQTALITGAASGIGQAFAKELAEAGYALVLVDKNRELLGQITDELQKKHQILLIPIVIDLSIPSSPEKIFSITEEKNIQIDFLINNAGYCIPEYFIEKNWQTHLNAIQVMAIDVVHLTYLYLPGMIERNYGRIIIPSSISAMSPGTPGDTLYESVKAFCLKFAESLSFEVTNYNIHVTAICPGYTRTRFHDVSGAEDIKKTLPNFLWLSPEQVARDGIEAVMKGKTRYVSGFIYKLIVILFEILPYRLVLLTTTLRQYVRQKKSSS